MADVAIEAGVPRDKILVETRAKNTGQNIQFTRALLKANGINAKKIICVQKPYAERRAYAAIRQQWPEVKVLIASPRLSYDEYMATSPRGKTGSVNVIVGDIQRIKLYADQGFQVPQPIPKEVWQAYLELVARGYTKSLASDSK